MSAANLHFVTSHQSPVTSHRSPSQHLALELAQVFDDAGAAGGLAGLADVAAVQDQPVVDASTVFPGAIRVRLETRKMWVSTAMVG